MLSSGALSSAISKRIVVKIGGKVSYCIHQKMNEIIRSVRLHFIVYIVPSIFARITKTVCQDNLTFDGQFIPFNPRRSRSCKSSAVFATVFLFVPPLALQIELIHDTRHLCSRFQVLKRTAGIKVMLRGFSGGKQTKNLPVQDLFYQIIGGSGFVVFWMQ